jgi:hypothetical protein
MAIKTFAVGEVLTASDTNTYLANSGLVYVTSTTVGSAVSSVTISNCFSSTYDNYRISFVGTTPSATDSFRFQLGSSTTGHYGSMYYDSWDGAATGTLRVGNAGSIYISLDEASTKTSGVIFDVLAPNLAQPTQMSGTWSGRGFAGWFGGLQSSSTAYTSFTIKPDSAGTFTGGVITVYGYRKA